MALMIELPARLEKKLLDRAANTGADLSSVATSLIEEALISEEQDPEEAVEGIRRGLEDCAAGRERSLSDFVVDQRAKHHFSSSWPNESDD